MSDLATRLSDTPDLYGALRALAAERPEVTLEDVLAALEAGGQAAGQAVARLRSVDQGLLRAVMRGGRGLSPVPGADAVRDHLAQARPVSLFRPAIAEGPTLALLTRGEVPDMPAFSDRAFDAWFAARGVAYGLGSYGEKRTVYATDQFADAASPERRVIHLGVDVFAPAMTPVHAPLPGVVRYVTYNADPLDYGHTLIVQHDAVGVPFFTLYGHLAGTLPGLLRPGDRIAAGQVIAHLGDWHENGGWAPHLHFQIITDLLEQRGGNFFGVGHESLWDVWQAISPDPNLILRLPEGRFRV